MILSATHIETQFDRVAEYWSPTVIGRRNDQYIDAENDASIALHEKLGFVHAGTIKQTAFKFSRWLDLAFYQLTLPTPANPIDG